jgi:GDPmannose 4,6-dehydratase
VVLGSAGQDGHYLTDYLATIGYRVVGIGRGRLLSGSEPRPFNLLDPADVIDLVRTERPGEFYYLAAHHHSAAEQQGTLRELFETSYDVHCRGLLNVLDAVVAVSPGTRIFYASSALIFGEPSHAPQREDTPMRPICAYGITKLAGMGLCRLYRGGKGVHCSAGILYNHESPKRGVRFVTRKIARAVAEIYRGERSSLTLGDFTAQVDWSFAGDVVRAMHAMLQVDMPQDFIIASGKIHTVREFAARAFAVAGLDYRKYVVEDPALIQRSRGGARLLGDPSRLIAATGWKPQASFEDLVDMMVKAELRDGGSTA